ncbi:hypothetical protein [Propionivibrio soli]|uniref:hypothetical protein n=1 Tax=Propionivibrio soli TaxID=2976531 RepID=UPI0021E8CCDD|nr:hypothetical protein [Propionivibrio soli]
MIFRLGGFGLLCIVGLFLLRDAHPYYSFGLLFAYTGFSIWLLCTSRHRASDEVTSSQTSVRLGEWPTTRSNHRVVGLLLLALAAVPLFFVQSAQYRPTALSVSICLFGLFVLYVARTALRFGYFPDTPKGRGVSKSADPLQYWITVALFATIGTSLLYVGVTRALKVLFQ